MYHFIDVNETSESTFLPSEALKINGEYIENLVEGYRTLSVSGREALSPELNIYETGTRDGAKLKSRRYVPRFIVIKYQLIADSNEAFRAAYNKLGGILNVQDAELIFNDEQDKFFVGTPSAIGEVEPGANSVVGEIEFQCNDPFKYSVQEYEAEASLDASSVLVNYNGTHKAFPTLEAEFYNETEVAEDGETAGALTGNGDCGFVAFFTEEEKIIQLGNPDEIDGVNDVPSSQTLINQTFKDSAAWGTTAKALWSMNSGDMPAEVNQTGSMAMGIASYAVQANPPSTSGTLLNITTSIGSPLLNYTITARTSGRTATSVNVTMAITASLPSYSGIVTKREIKGSLYIGGAWYSLILKKSTVNWLRNNSYTSNLNVTVNGLSADTNALTGILFKAERTDSLGQSGILPQTACNNLAISPYVAGEPETYYLCANDYGSPGNGWQGPSMTRQIGADAGGVIGAENFVLTYAQKMCIGNTNAATNQLGGFRCNITDASGNVVAGVRIVKAQPGSRTASIMLFVNGQKVHEAGIDLSYHNQYFGAGSNSAKTSKITKRGNTIYFNIGGYSRSFVDDELSTVKATKVGFMFERYASTAQLAYNGIYSVKFVKDNCDTWRDIPNKFSANDIVRANCNTGEIFLNGISAPELGALGNDWENFFLKPGLNQIGFAYSSWVADGYEPNIKIRYREVFL